uniref:Papilin n=1 Tax=Trichuris muris TaxID=70415 RepID=A0A5S6QUU6_TRIMR
MWVHLLELTTFLSMFPAAYSLVDPCQRQPFKATCDSLLHGRLIGRSQFVLRFYRRENECVSYPFALCRGDKSHAELFKRKEDCELACLAKVTTMPLAPTSQAFTIPYTKKFTSAQVFAGMQTSPVKEVTASSPRPTVLPETALPPKLTKCQERRMLAQQARRPGSGKVDIQSAVIYQCTSDGAFEQVQCHQASGVCWCVNEDGYEIANTRTQGGNVRPDCSGRPLSTVAAATTKSWITSSRKAPVARCANGAPALDSLGRLYNCFVEQCPHGYRCAIQDSEAICCPDMEGNSVASNLISPSDVCDLPKDRGSCNKFELRFYFNSEFKECKYFFYGGCGGNGNNFKELSQCEKTCGRSSTSKQKVSDKDAQALPATEIVEDKHCDQPKDPGPCAGRFIRWYWNTFTSSCEVFVYSGCKGSGNNFASREQCIEMCGYKQPTSGVNTTVPPSTGTTKSPTTVKPRVSTVARVSPVTVTASTMTHSITSPTPFTTSASTTFQTAAVAVQKPKQSYEKKVEPKEEKCRNEQCSVECIEITNSRGCIECMCPQTELAGRQPLVTRQPTIALSTQVNTTSGMQEAKTDAPSSKTQPPPPVEKCLLPLDVGLCGGPPQPRWGFSRATNRCERFDYSGCGGNMNHFYSLKECNILCAKYILPRASEPTAVPTTVSPGSFSDRTSEAPSAVAIVTAESVLNEHAKNDEQGTSTEKIREDVDPVCSLPRDSGPCMNFVIKWFYNAVTGRCERFQYGSCGGNSNNFESLETCNARCVAGIQSVGVSVPDACAQEKDSGPCEGYNVRFYYNGRSMRCELFVYGGCGGNSNNFESKDACDDTCPVYEKVWRQTLPSFGRPPFVQPALPPATFAPSNRSKQATVTEAAKQPVFGAAMRHESVGSSVVIEDLPRIDVTVPVEHTFSRSVPTEDYRESSTVSVMGYGEPGGDVETAMVGNEQAPMCPNGLPSKVDSQGQVILCLPGKALCPPTSSCYFNGIDFFCCPMEEIGALPLAPSTEKNAVYESAPADYGKRGKRQLPISPVELAAPSMLPNLPVVSPLRAPSLGAPYQIGSASQTIAHNYQRSQMVNGIFGPRSEYHYSIPQPPTLGGGFLGATGGRPDYCELPKNPGPCKGSHLRYYYDPAFDDCQLFYYGGCQGNRNNFGTVDVCRKECVKRPRFISCPGGLLPLGGKTNPVACGPTAGGFACPDGFFCQKGMFPMCCPQDGGTKDLPKGAPDSVPPAPKMIPPPIAIEPPPSRTSSRLTESIERNEVAAVQTSPNEQTVISNPLRLPQGEQPNVNIGNGQVKTYASQVLPGTEKQLVGRNLPGQPMTQFANMPAAASFHPGAARTFPQQNLVPNPAGFVHQRPTAGFPLQRQVPTGFMQSRRPSFQQQTDGQGALQPSNAGIQSPVFIRPEQQLQPVISNVPADRLSLQSFSAEGGTPPLCRMPAHQGHSCRPNESPTRSNDFYYYDSTQRECFVLKYAGCGGNDNRFSSRNDCYRVCHQGLLPVGT